MASTKRTTVQEYCAKHNQSERKARKHLRAMGIRATQENGRRHSLSAADQRKLSKSLGV